MLELNTIIKCEKDIEWLYVEKKDKTQFEFAKHSMVTRYYALYNARKDYITHTEECLMSKKDNFSHDVFDNYAYAFTRFYNAYLIYCQCVAKLKGVQL